MTGNKQNDYFEAILNAVPSPIFVVDEEVRVVEHNEAAAPLLDQNPGVALRLRAGEALHCLHAASSPEGCGRGRICEGCVIRNSVRQSFNGQRVSRRAVRMDLVRGRSIKQVHVLVTTSPFSFKDHRYILLILEDISELAELRRIIPICANCKRIRNDQEYWEQLEAYFKTRLDLDFTHGICPDCLKTLYPDLYSKLLEEKETQRSEPSSPPAGPKPPARRANGK